MVEPLSVDTDGVRAFGDIHTGVATGLGALATGAPGSAEVAMSHGAIASGVNSALAATLGSRSGSMNATQGSAKRLAELLHQAALAYERGDERGGAAIKAAADAIARGETPATPSAATSAGSTAATSAGSTGATDAIGQVAGQLGQLPQQLGQLPQQVGAPLAAVAEPLQQLPQGMMEGGIPAGSESGEHADAPQDTNDADVTPGAQPDSGAAPPIDRVTGPANQSGTDAASPRQR